MHLGVRWETASGRWGADVGQVNQAGAGRHRGRGCGRSGPGGSWCGITGPDHPGHGRGTDRGRADAVPGPSPAEAGEAVGARPLDGNGPPGLPQARSPAPAGDPASGLASALAARYCRPDGHRCAPSSHRRNSHYPARAVGPASARGPASSLPFGRPQRSGPVFTETAGS